MNSARHRHRLAKALDLEDLGADVRVHAVEGQSRDLAQLVDRSACFAGRYRESELGVLLTGANILVSVRLNARESRAPAR